MPRNGPRPGPAGHADDGSYVLARFDGDVGDDVVVVVVGVGVGEFDDLLGAGDLALGWVVWMPVVGLSLSLWVLGMRVMLEWLAVVWHELSRLLLMVMGLMAVPGDLAVLWRALNLMHVGPRVAGHESGIVDLVGELMLDVVFRPGGVREVPDVVVVAGAVADEGKTFVARFAGITFSTLADFDVAD